MNHTLATLILPFPAERAGRVNRLLIELGDAAGARHQAIRQALLADAFIHFMSIVVVPPAAKCSCAHLLVEITADGHAREAVSRLARAIPTELQEILEASAAEGRTHYHFADYLISRIHEPSPAWPLRGPGLGFEGTPDLSLERIAFEARLAGRVAQILQDLRPSPALAKLHAVKSVIFADPALKKALLAEPMARIVGPVKRERRKEPIAIWLGVLALGARDFLWPLLLGPALITFFWIMLSGIDPGLWRQWWAQLHVDGTVGGIGLVVVDTLTVATFTIWRMLGFFEAAALRSAIALALSFLVTALLVIGAYRRLRRQEEEDVPLDLEPGRGRMAQILRYEDQRSLAQNHLAAVSVMKPGIVRAAALRLALAIIREGARRSSPGFLDRIGSIHFARWLQIPGTNQLVFLSNYDGSWQSYLEDFIARLREGLSTVWSNTVNFPKTKRLTEGGAGDGVRFKRWARRQQLPTRFWFSAYPELPTHRIRINAQIRHGLASATTEEEAANWLSLFGFASRESLEFQEIPTLVFGGLPKMPFAHCLVLQLPDGAAAKAWLGGIRGHITYGDRTPASMGLVAGFTATGLGKLGLGARALSTFPMAFQQGMADRRRALALGDVPDQWEWEASRVDAVLMLYATSAADLGRHVRQAKEDLQLRGGAIVREISTSELPSSKEIYEAFGFRDGISQPVMQGTLRASRERDGRNLVNPGELVLGYADNLRVVAPTPRTRGHDIGRNGSYLVVRQIEQDPDAFGKYLADAAQVLARARDPRVPTHDPAALAEWIAAKMVGRWKDGSSLVRHPHRPANAVGVAGASDSASAAEAASAASQANRKAPPDNNFLFGKEDPDGLRCPFGAHVRRANPRDSFEPGSEMQLEISNRHRILRVGRNYPAVNGSKPGLLFMCVNADIERQFEFLQQTWILGRDFHGLQGEVDPIVGTGQQRTMVVPTPSGPLRLPTLGSFVRVLGGGYFFMPSRATVEILTA